MAKRRERPELRSAWANGSFYLALFAVIVAGVAVLSKTAPWYAFPMALLAALVYVPMIGVMEIYRNDQMTEKSFLKVLRLVIGQLPVIGSLARTPNQEGAPRSPRDPKPEA